ncbi:hypothetical protein EKO04_004481 [Ascochyta lentis]|uniref:Ecp2 effector protein domain-containing protein n=1 Tax=Ascochyta lentis TaxID=205686 RepID=A0A8H7J6S4_9PLEO|nr:hypothetical protein EKO04_004481 [Ascochyta lentis]
MALFLTSALLALSAFTANAYPHPEPAWTHNVEPTNTTLSARAEKGICTTQDLPTESSYKTAYEAFCNKFVPGEGILSVGDDDLVGTVLIQNNVGADLPWVFKVSSWVLGGDVSYSLTRDMCMTKFREVVEGEDAKLGVNYCFVDTLQGVKLVKGGTVKHHPRPRQSYDYGKFETRKRKGKFDRSKEKEV